MTWFLCGEPGAARRPVLYADSEGRATLVAEGLVEAVELIAVLPHWQDAGAGVPLEELAAVVHEDHPDFEERRSRLVAALGIAPPPPEEVLARLRETAAATAPDFVPIADVDGAEPYEWLFGDRV